MGNCLKHFPRTVAGTASVLKTGVNTIKQRVYCVFEGAGARGLAHIGALNVIDKDKNLEISGYAGTSAGAIVAALAASGYSADEMYSYKTGKGILDVLDEDPNNNDVKLTNSPVTTPPRLLGKSAWLRIRLVRWLISNHQNLYYLAAILFTITSLYGLIFLPKLAILIYIATLISILIFLRSASEGFTSLSPVKDSINQLLNMKLFGTRRGKTVTFHDLSEAGRPPLRIVAANITTNEISLFSAETTPNISVADAVCASICLPGIFKAHRIGDDEYLDGGLVSNLPAWVFDDERTCDRDALTAAIQIVEKVATQSHSRDNGSISKALKTMLVGSAPLNKRAIENLTTTTLEVDLGLLDFDLSRSDAEEILKYSEGYCQTDLIKKMIKLPQTINDACRDTAKLCSKTIAEAHRISGESNYKSNIRVAVGTASSLQKSIKIEFSSGYENLSDERLCLPIDSSLMGEAWLEGSAVYAASQDIVTWNKYLNRPQDRWQRKLVWRDLKWVLCVPLDLKSGTRVVISVDGDEDLRLNDADQQALLNSLEGLILSEFDILKKVDEELPNGS